MSSGSPESETEAQVPDAGVQGSGRDASSAADDGHRGVLSEQETAALLESSPQGQVRAFDITACKISRTRLPNLEHIAKTFGVRASTTLSQLVGHEVRIAFDGLDRGKSADRLAALPNPACLAVVRLKPLPELAIFATQPALLLAMLDGFFGGACRAPADAAAAASPAAQRFLGVMTRNLAPDFVAAWQPIAPVECELVKQEHDARFVQLGAAHDTVIIVRFIAQLGELNGALEWLLPEAALAPVREALSADGSVRSPRDPHAWTPELSAALMQAQLETRAVLSEATMSLRELVSLAPGDIVPIEAPEHVTLLAENVPLFRGRFGVSQGRNALKILDGVSV